MNYDVQIFTSLDGQFFGELEYSSVRTAKFVDGKMSTGPQGCRLPSSKICPLFSSCLCMCKSKADITEAFFGIKQITIAKDCHFKKIPRAAPVHCDHTRDAVDSSRHFPPGILKRKLPTSEK